MAISTREAARRLQVSPQRVLVMLRDGLISGRRLDRIWLVDEASVAARAGFAAGAGRPWSAGTVDRIINALSQGQALDSRESGLLHRLDAEELGGKIGQAVTIRRFTSRWSERARDYLIPTGESAIDSITVEPWQRIHAGAHGVHGYVRGETSLEDFITAARLVDDPEGHIFVHAMRNGAFTWDETPQALVAADCMRSTSTRARTAGVEALLRMRNQWLANTN